MFSPFADAEVILKLPSAIKKRITDGANINDLLGEFGRPGFGDSNPALTDAFLATNPTISRAWAGSAFTASKNNLDFVTFLQDGTAKFGAYNGSDVTPQTFRGFYITPRVAVLDSKIGANAGDYDTPNTDLNWTGVSGTWVTTRILTPFGGTGIQNRGADEIVVAKTLGTIPGKRAHHLKISLQGALSNAGPPAELRHFFGDKYCVVVPVGEVPYVGRITYDENGTNGVISRMANFKDVEEVKAGGNYRVSVFCLAGRLCVTFQGVTLWLYDTDSGKPRDVSWPAAGWQLELVNVRARVEYSVIKWSQANGTSLTGTLERAAMIGNVVDAQALDVNRPAGWLRGGTKAEVAPSVIPGGVKYLLTFTGGPDGIDTPVVDKVVVRYAPTWTSAVNNQINVRNSCESISLSVVAPPDGAGAQGTIVLDRTSLENDFPNWEAYAKLWNPVEISIKRAGSAFSKVFEGYIFKPTRTSGLGADRKISIVVRDPLVRLQKLGECNNAPVDHHYGPLDLLFARKVATSATSAADTGIMTPAVLYIAECVQDLLRSVHGDSHAALLNGNGDPLRFIGSGHPALISTRNDTAGWSQIEQIGATDTPVSTGSWLVPPPYGSSVYDWIMELAQKDRCVFYYGWPDGDTSGPPVPIYGRLERILAAQDIPLHYLPDTVTGADWSRLLQSIEVERRPERDINVVDVWAQEARGLEAFLPSLRIGSASLPVTDDRSSVHTWERKLIIRDPIAMLGAEAIAAGVIRLLTDVDMQWPSFTFEGDERVGLGHLVKPTLSGTDADASLGFALNGGGRAFRVERIEHNINFKNSPGDYKMTVYPRPLTYLEARAFDGFSS